MQPWVLLFIRAYLGHLTRSLPLARPSGQPLVALSRTCPGARLWLKKLFSVVLDKTLTYVVTYESSDSSFGRSGLPGVSKSSPQDEAFDLRIDPRGHGGLQKNAC